MRLRLSYPCCLVLQEERHAYEKCQYKDYKRRVQLAKETQQ